MSDLRNPSSADADRQDDEASGTVRKNQWLRTREVHHRVTLYVIRGIFLLAAGGIGLYTSQVFKPEKGLVTILAALAIAVVVMVGEIFFSRAPIRTLAAVSFGLIMGLALSLVFQPVVELIVNAVSREPAAEITRLLQLVTTTLFCYYGVTVLLQTGDDFKFIIPYVEFRKDVRGHVPLIIDTSMIIDGRIVAFLKTRFIDQRLLVPKFILGELQGIADSPDRARRERGRRGMDILQEIRRDYGVEILERELPGGAAVDHELLKLAEELGAKLLTSDFNLQKRAGLHGVPVININDLATALKPVVVPGESLRVRLLREGDDAGQAVGFLEDGTMVVVENASRKIGQEVTIEVTSATQTSAGKMVFGRLKRSGPRRGRRDRRRPSGEGAASTVPSKSRP